MAHGNIGVVANTLDSQREGVKKIIELLGDPSMDIRVKKEAAWNMINLSCIDYDITEYMIKEMSLLPTLILTISKCNEKLKEMEDAASDSN